MYSEKAAPRKEIFYSGNEGSSLLFKARTNSLEVNNRTYRFNENRERRCKMCIMTVEDTVDHFIVECPVNDIARVKTMGEYKGTLGDSKLLIWSIMD